VESSGLKEYCEEDNDGDSIAVANLLSVTNNNNNNNTDNF